MTANDGAIVRVVDVEKRYQQGDLSVRAVAGVSFEVRTGEFVSIMGPSGSGKSTLLHLIGGLDVPDAGDVLMADRQFSRMTDDQLTIMRRRLVGIVFQFFNLIPTLTAAENVGLPLLLDGVPKHEAVQRVERMLDLVGLSNRAGHRPDQLSGGEMQRIAIARGLVIKPLLLLADEPTGALDSRTGDEIFELIGEMRTRFELTVIMVTHDHRAASFGDRVITMKDGKIVDDGLTEGKRLPLATRLR